MSGDVLERLCALLEDPEEEWVESGRGVLRNHSRGMAVWLVGLPHLYEPSCIGFGVFGGLRLRKSVRVAQDNAALRAMQPKEVAP